MIRVLTLLLCLWGLSHWHSSYKSREVATAITGPELQQRPSGLLSVTGVVTARRQKPDGTMLLTLEAQGSRVTAYAGPLVEVFLPDAGRSVTVTGQAIAPGMIAIKTLNVVAPLHETSYAQTSRPGAISQRVSFPIAEARLLNRVSRSGLHAYVWFQTPSGDAYNRGMVATDQTAGLANAHRVNGYVNENNWFIIEGYE